MTAAITRLRGVPYPWRVLWVHVTAVFMTVLDGTMVNVALPHMARDFDVAVTSVEWVSVGYLLAVAVVVPASGWLADRFGAKRMFVMSLAGFTISSLACGLARTLDQLVALRVVQGVTGGALAPIGGALLFKAFPISQRATAAAALLSVAVTAPAIGPALGGVLVDHISWRWIFLINVPIGIVGVLVARRLLREEPPVATGRFDAAGFVLVSVAMISSLWTLSNGPGRGWGSPSVLVAAALAAVTTIGAILVETRSRAPMLPLRLLGDGLFRTVNALSAFVYASFFGHVYLLPIFLQTALGRSASVSGLVQSPQALGVLVVSVGIGRTAYRVVGPRRLIGVGSVVGAITTVAFALVGPGTSLWTIAALSLVRGIAFGFVFLSVQTAVYATTSHADIGRATSLFNSQRQFSYAAGVAVAATILAALLPAGAGGAVDAYQTTFVWLGVMAVPVAVLARGVRDAAVAATRGVQRPGDLIDRRR